MSTVTLSQPHWAMTSDEKPDGIANQALTQALPAFNRALSLFMKFPLVSVGKSDHQRCRLNFRQSKKRHVRFGSILLKKSKIKRRQKSRKIRFWGDSRLRCFAASIRSSMVVLLRSDVVPRVAAHETHQQPWKFSFPTPKRLFQQYRPVATR